MERLFTYARGEALDQQQLDYLTAEGKPYAQDDLIKTLVDDFNNQVDNALYKLSNINESTLTEIRGVGRAQIPSTVIGLLVHAAEHTQRHYGQLLVTVKVLQSQ